MSHVFGLSDIEPWTLEARRRNLHARAIGDRFMHGHVPHDCFNPVQRTAHDS